MFVAEGNPAMNMKTVKNLSDVSLAGVSVELEKTDGNVTGVIITDGKGGRLVARKTDWGMTVLVPAPPKMVKRHRIEGKLKGIPFREDFEHAHQATQRLVELGLENDPMEGTIKEVEIPEEMVD